MKRRTLGMLLLGLCLALSAWLFWPSAPIAVALTPTPPDATTVERGRYLATLGNCQTCHTTRGGQAYAGGRPIATPFGAIYSSNLTPSPSGLGGWTSGDFWRALHHGQSRDGRWLYPAFPYNNTTHIDRADSDALFAYLSSLTAVERPTPPHEIGWPLNTQAALKVWRALYFQPGPDSPTTAQSPLERGAYLVRGLGHCSACHAPRNLLGASSNMLDLAGGLIPVQNWYAPSLNDPAEAGVQDWPLDDIVTLFQTGRSPQGRVTGPMAEVVLQSTQHWKPEDLQAMAGYLKGLPTATAAPKPATVPSLNTGLADQGAKLYRQHCAQCHGEQGEGIRGLDGQFAYPALAGNRMVSLASPANLVQTVLHGGFGPATPGNPRPFGMPPFMLSLSDAELAAVLTHLRTQWGHQASPVSVLEVQQLRGATTP